jgi:malate dehydrogenase (oxaloacetate-decarboxylating)(NADP+)
MAIAENPQDVYQYTAKGNLGSGDYQRHRGTGLGRHWTGGEQAGHGGERRICFKVFADIDVFDIEVDASQISITLSPL